MGSPSKKRGSQEPRSRAELWFLLALFAAGGILLSFIIAPFAGALFAAAVFATVLSTPQEKLTAKFGDRPKSAAALLTVGFVIFALLPLSALAVYVGVQVSEWVQETRQTLEEQGVSGWIEDLPSIVQLPAREVVERVPPSWFPSSWRKGSLPHENPRNGESSESEEQADAAAPAAMGPDLETVAEVSTDVLAQLANWLLQIAIFVAALFFLLSEGGRLLSWLVELSPLPDDELLEFTHEFRDVTVSIFVSTFVAALLQTIVAAIGYAIAGSQGLPILVFLTLLSAIIPAIGGAPVVFCVGLVRLFGEDVFWGVFLLVWAVVAVGFVDNLAKPYFARHRSGLPGSVLFFAMIGGLIVMGPMGIVGGPLIVSFFLVSTRALKGSEG